MTTTQEAFDNFNNRANDLVVIIKDQMLSTVHRYAKPFKDLIVERTMLVKGSIQVGTLQYNYGPQPVYNIPLGIDNHNDYRKFYRTQ